MNLSLGQQEQSRNKHGIRYDENNEIIFPTINVNIINYYGKCFHIKRILKFTHVFIFYCIIVESYVKDLDL